MTIIIKVNLNPVEEKSESLSTKELSPVVKEAILFEEILRRQKKLNPKLFGQKQVKIKK